MFWHCCAARVDPERSCQASTTLFEMHSKALINDIAMIRSPTFKAFSSSTTLDRYCLAFRSSSTSLECGFCEQPLQWSCKLPPSKLS